MFYLHAFCIKTFYIKILSIIIIFLIKFIFGANEKYIKIKDKENKKIGYHGT